MSDVVFYGLVFFAVMAAFIAVIHHVRAVREEKRTVMMLQSLIARMEEHDD